MNFILGLCDRFHCTPDVARQMDASVIRMLKIEKLGNPEQKPEPPDELGGEYA